MSFKGCLANFLVLFVLFFLLIEMYKCTVQKKKKKKNIGTGQTPCSVASDLDLHCLLSATEKLCM